MKITLADYSGAFLVIKPYRLKDLAGMYGVSCNTFRRWLRPFRQRIGERMGRYYTVNQVRIIFDCLDTPDIAGPTDEK